MTEQGQEDKSGQQAWNAILRIVDVGVRIVTPIIVAAMIGAATSFWQLESRVTVIEHTAYTHKDAQVERERTDAKLEEIRNLIVGLSQEVAANNHGPLFVNLTKQVEAMTAEMRSVNEYLRERP